MWPGAGTIGSPTDPEVGAEGVEPGDLSTVSATLLGAFDGIGRLPTQHRDCGSNSSGYNILGPASRDRRREPQHAKGKELAHGTGIRHCPRHYR
jgi:hypothetical protein